MLPIVAAIPAAIATFWIAGTFGTPPIYLMIFGLFFIPIYLGLSAIASVLSMFGIGGRNAFGLATSGIYRRMVYLIIWWIIALLILWIAFDIGRGFTPHDPFVGFYLMAFVLFALVSRPAVRVVISRVTKPIRGLFSMRFFGFGGGGKFAGMVEEWGALWKPGQIMLGTSLYSGQKVGVRDDRHIITVATSRSGKGRSGIVPNLLTWPGSALVIDPKGQNAAITAATRGKGDGKHVSQKHTLGQKVIVLDPFQELKNIGVELETHHYNPLSEIDVHALDVVERIGNIADGIVQSDPVNPNYWDRSAKNLIAGLIAYVLTESTIPPEQRNLGKVRDLLARGKLPLDLMATNVAAGGLAASAAAQLNNSGENARGDIIGSTLDHTKWLDSRAMRELLHKTDFSMKELKDPQQPCTIYLVLPPAVLDEHSRFLRLFVNMALRATTQGQKPPHSILFVLDEFYALGKLDLIATAAGLLAGYGVKLWPIVQNLGQIQQLYRENWEAFLGNAGLWQAFAMNDATTANYLSERLGHHVRWKKFKDPETGKEEWIPSGATFLRTSSELGQQISRDSGRSVVFQEGGNAFILKRANYDDTFPLDAYCPDPYETEGRVASLGRKINQLGAEGNAKAEARMDRLIERWFGDK